MSDATGKRANGLHPLSAKKLRLHPLLLCDVGIDYEYRSGRSLIVAHQGPATLHNNLGAVATNLMNFTAPLALLDYGLPGIFKLGRRLLRSNSDGVLADGFLGGPAIHALGSFVPEQNVLIEIAHQNCVLRLIQ